MDDEELAAIEGVLRERAAALGVRLDEMAAAPERGSGISFGKRVGDGTSIAVERLSQVAAHDRLTDMLGEVRRAEAKQAEGTYGLCDVDGQPIPEARLEALPWATTCVAHGS